MDPQSSLPTASKGDPGGDIRVVGYDSVLGYEPSDEDERHDNITQAAIDAVSRAFPSIADTVRGIVLPELADRVGRAIDALDEGDEPEYLLRC